MRTRDKILLLVILLFTSNILLISNNKYIAYSEENETSTLKIEYEIDQKFFQYLGEYENLIEEKLQGFDIEEKFSILARGFCQEVEGIISSINADSTLFVEKLTLSIINGNMNEADKSSGYNRKFYLLQSLLLSECLLYNVDDKTSILGFQQNVYWQLKEMELFVLVSLLNTKEPVLTLEEEFRQYKIEVIRYTLSKNVEEYILLKKRQYQDDEMVQILKDIIEDLEDLAITYEEAGLDEELQPVQKVLNMFKNELLTN